VIIAPDPWEIWEQIEEFGGALVENNQVIRIVMDDMDDFNGEFLLEVTAIDDSGNSATAIDALPLGEDDDDDDDDDDD
jgi:hypothetical protein